MTDRQIVKQFNRDRAKVMTVGIQAAKAASARVAVNVVRAWRRGGSVGLALQDEMLRAVPLLRDAMIVAHLMGASRTLAIAKKWTRASQPVLQFEIGTIPKKPVSQFRGAMTFLKRRVAVPQHELKALASLYEAEALTVMQGLGATAEKALQQTIAEIQLRGVHVREGVEMLDDTFARMGITPVNSYTLEGIYRTQTALAQSVGKWQQEQDEAIQEILWGYAYSTVGDERVRPEHDMLEGVTLPKSDPFWQINTPPNGYSCRCVAIPVYERREQVQPPPPVEEGNRLIVPGADKGFRFNPGALFASA